VKKALVSVWEILNYPSSKRLRATLKEVALKLKEFGEFFLDEEKERKILKISTPQ